MEKLREQLAGVVRELCDAPVEVELTVPPEETGADYASNVAMKLAGVLQQAPMAIAGQVAGKMRELGGYEVEVAKPGFLNFMLPDEYFCHKIAEIGENTEVFTENISPDEYSGKMVIAEFSDPNPFKVLHVGHFYTSVVGDAISRMLECAGAKVVRANFGGDVGLHVAKTIYALCLGPLSGEELLDSLTIERIGEAYVEGTRAYEEDEEARTEITALNKEIYRINAQEVHEGEVAELYWRGRELSYRYFDEFYQSIGVKFDKYYPESTVAQRGLDEVKAHTGTTYEESDGAIVFRGEKVRLHTRVFINREGVPTYEAKDVGLIFTKWDDYRFDESVVVTGNEQTEYMKVVLASISEYAPELTERTVHLTHGMVRLPGNEKMSSRKGNFLKAVEVLEMVRGELVRVREDEMAADDTMLVDERVVLAAIKYAFLRYKIGGDIIFDPRESVATTGNSGVYLLYSVVRGKKILEAIGEKRGKLANFGTVWEKKLGKKIVQYQEVLNGAVYEKAPNKLCTYLYELAQEFSRFYENVKVAGNEREGELAGLVGAYVRVMEHGLGLLGIEVPAEM